MIEDLASDYANYMKVDLQSELHDVQETIDDMLIRLDEFENLVNMVKTDSELCANISIPIVLHSKEKLDSLCSQIDALEKLVSRAKSDMEIVEMQVEEAEAVMGQPSGTLKNIFKPLFLVDHTFPLNTISYNRKSQLESKKKSPSEPSSKKIGRTPTTYAAPDLFSTSSFFPSQNEEAVHKKES